MSTEGGWLAKIYEALTGGGGGSAVAANLTQVNGSSISLGQKTSASSYPVVIASDQGPLFTTSTPSPTADGPDLSVGTADETILTANPSRTVVVIQNVSTAANLGVRCGAAAALNTGGTYMLLPYGSLQLVGTEAQAAIHAIASIAATPVTVRVG